MDWCCISRPEKERENDYKNISNRNLEVNLKREKNKKSRHCWFGTLYTVTSLGSGLATIFSGGTSSLATIPTTALATVASYDSFNMMYDADRNEKAIRKVLKKRKDAEIVFVDNKNGVTIYNKDYIESKKIHQSIGNNFIENDSLNVENIDKNKNIDSSLEPKIVKFKKKNITLELISI